MCWMVNRSAVLRCSMAVEFWTRRQPVTSYPSKGKGRNNPFSFENFKTFVGGLSHTVAFAFGTRETKNTIQEKIEALRKEMKDEWDIWYVKYNRINNQLTELDELLAVADD